MTHRAPETIEIRRGGRSLVYRREPRWTCVTRDEPVPQDASRSSLPDEGLVVVDSAGSAAGRPVYRLENGPLPFVPTGRLFVRLSPDRRLDGFATDLAGLGLRVSKINAWAPHTGWVEAADGGVADALGRIDDVRRALAADSVEPEMLTAKR